MEVEARAVGPGVAGVGVTATRATAVRSADLDAVMPAGGEPVVRVVDARALDEVAGDRADHPGPKAALARDDEERGSSPSRR